MTKKSKKNYHQGYKKNVQESRGAYTGEKSKKYKSTVNPDKFVWYQDKKYLKSGVECTGHYVGNECNC